MTDKENITYLIENYNQGHYDTFIFCDLFYQYYKNMDIEELSTFSQKWLEELSEICGRYSDSPEDFAIFSNVYYDQKAVKKHTIQFQKSFLYNCYTEKDRCHQ